ncbi:hypothetical protein ACWEVP_04110 [Amycolatopsis sp. NPDC003865]
MPAPSLPDGLEREPGVSGRARRAGLLSFSLLGLTMIVFVTVGETLRPESLVLLGVGFLFVVLGFFLLRVGNLEALQWDEDDEWNVGRKQPDDEISRYLRSPEFDDFGTWTARLALRVLVEDALADETVIKALAGEHLQREDARLSILADDSLTGRIRIEQDRVARAEEQHSWPGLHPLVRLANLPAGHYGWLTAVAVFDIGYISLMRAVWPWLPLPLHVIAVAGFISVAVLSVRTVGRRAPGVLGWTGDDMAEEPHPELLILGDRREYLLVEVVVPAIHEFVRANRSVRFGTRLVHADIGNLAEVDDGETVMTAGAERMRRIIERSGAGAVALAGSRGVGKTTVIRAMREGRLSAGESRPLVVMASAPANYEARDFVLHLHALLCRTVIDEMNLALYPLLPDGPEGLWAAVRRSGERVVRFLIFAVVCWSLAWFLWGGSLSTLWQEVRALGSAAVASSPSSVDALWTEQPLGHRIALGLIGLVALRAALALVVVPVALLVSYIRRRMRDDLLDLRKSALQQLAETRFLQTHTSGWSGKLSLPLKGEAGRTWSTQRAEQQLTHPEIVEKLRLFAEESSEVLRENGVVDRMVIAIDELDKIGEPEKAQQFINDIKGVFGVPGCLFFVSVSDDAVHNFEQRGLGVRDAFDSAFSEMVRLEHFTLNESRQWVMSRLPRVTEEFCYLLHCLSGGLPRDLHRYTVEVIDVAARVYEPSLAVVAGTLVQKDLSSKVHALVAHLSTLDVSSEQLAFIAKLLAVREAEGAFELGRVARDLIRDTRPDSVNRIDILRWNAGCAGLFCATVLEIFADDLAPASLTDEFNELALARRQMQAQPHLAWQRIVTFRKARDLEPEAYVGN